MENRQRWSTARWDSRWENLQSSSYLLFRNFEFVKSTCVVYFIKECLYVWIMCVRVSSLTFISYLIIPKAHPKHFTVSSLHSLSCLFFPIQQPPFLHSYINKLASDLENSLSTQIVCWEGRGTPEHLFQFTPQHCLRTLEGLWWKSLQWCFGKSWVYAVFLRMSACAWRVMSPDEWVALQWTPGWVSTWVLSQKYDTKTVKHFYDTLQFPTFKTKNTQ